MSKIIYELGKGKNEITKQNCLNKVHIFASLYIYEYIKVNDIPTHQKKPFVVHMATCQKKFDPH